MAWRMAKHVSRYLYQKKKRKSQTSRSRERMKSAGRPVESQFPETTRWTLLDEKNAKGITMEEGSALGREEEKN